MTQLTSKNTLELKSLMKLENGRSEKIAFFVDETCAFQIQLRKLRKLTKVTLALL